ncbi:MAG: ComEC family competence protein [Candidatus Peregrinibacteria bacterium]|nr:ComEC family competence protein [Candidatus Peregrinibacteria bacterium]MCB9808171.1 ComEC family competence protein [Candidatus Peribacteria bacterium]
MHRLSYSFLIGFLSTTFLLQWYEHPEYTRLLLCTLCLFCTLCILGRLLIASTCLGIILSLLTVSHTTHLTSPQSIDYYADGTVQTLIGTIVDEPDRRPLHTKYALRIDGLEGKLLVSDYRNWPRYQYGDRIQVSGKLERPEAIEDFAYDKYLSRYGIYAVIYRSSILLKAKSNNQTTPQKIRRNLYRLKESFEQRLNLLFPEPHASFMAGLLTGSRKGIPDDLMQAFNATGLTHIIAISGYNITIVITVIAGLLFWIPPQFRIIPSIGAIALFTLFVGASAAVVRAAIMGCLGLLALQSNRSGSMRLTMLLTAFCMVIVNPKILWYDAGFQLSFLAVIGVTELAPILQPLLRRIPQTLGIREALQMTIAAQLTAVPLISMLFGRVSLVAPLSNILVAPCIPLAMLFGCIAVMLSVISLPIALGVSYLGWLCLEWIIQVAHATTLVPLASINLAIPPWMLIPYYILLLLTIRRGERSLSRRATEQACF